MSSKSTVPTQSEITLVPENLLKKRKSQEKAREERAIATREKRGTTNPSMLSTIHEGDYDDYNYHTIG
ncbi:hypothetical protein J4E80_000600 [Alternaria sp. BMP 0032]|nr:hypothetical protein J4E80_000600 [Alternaria sp. BMP 0032]